MTKRTEKGTKKHHKPINDAIRAGRGVAVDVPLSIPESSEKMGAFVRASTGRTNGKDNKRAALARRVAAVSKGYILADDGETILHDIREEDDGG